MVPAPVAQEVDPLVILRWTAGIGAAGLTRQTDAALRTAELVAVASAEPTP